MAPSGLAERGKAKSTLKTLKSGRFTSAPLALSALVTAIVLLWLFQSVSFREVTDLVVHCHKGALLVFLALSLGTSFFRMWRYHILLAATGFRVKKLALFLVVLVRNFCSDLLPARIGGLIYVFLVTTRLGVPLESATSSFGLAFFLDILGLAPLVLCAAFAADLDPALLVLFGAGVGLASLLLIFKLDLLLRLPAAFLGRFGKHALAAHITRFLKETATRVEETKHAGILPRLFVLSVMVRSGKYLSLYFFLYALLAPQGYGFAELPFPKVFIGLLVPEIAASLPVSGIAGIGAYQGAWVYAFRLLGFPLDIAKTTSLSHHLFTQLYGYSIGLLSLLVLSIAAFRSSTLLKTASRPQTSFDFTLSLLLSMAALGAASALLFALAH